MSIFKNVENIQRKIIFNSRAPSSSQRKLISLLVNFIRKARRKYSFILVLVTIYFSFTIGSLIIALRTFDEIYYNYSNEIIMHLTNHTAKMLTNLVTERQQNLEILSATGVLQDNKSNPLERNSITYRLKDQIIYNGLLWMSEESYESRLSNLQSVDSQANEINLEVYIPSELLASAVSELTTSQIRQLMTKARIRFGQTLVSQPLSTSNGRKYALLINYSNFTNPGYLIAILDLDFLLSEMISSYGRSGVNADIKSPQLDLFGSHDKVVTGKSKIFEHHAIMTNEVKYLTNLTKSIDVSGTIWNIEWYFSKQFHDSIFLTERSKVLIIAFTIAILNIILTGILIYWLEIYKEINAFFKRRFDKVEARQSRLLTSWSEIVGAEHDKLYRYAETISGYAELILQSTQKKSPAQNKMPLEELEKNRDNIKVLTHKLQESSNDMRHELNQIFMINQLNKPNTPLFFTSFNVNLIIDRQTEKLRQEAAKRQIKFGRVTNLVLGEITTDVGLFSLLIELLLMNILESGQDQSTVDISAVQVTRQNEDDEEATSPFIEIKICNRGLGLPKDQRLIQRVNLKEIIGSRKITPQMTNQPQLILARAIVICLGLELTMESILAEGLTFTLEIPKSLFTTS